MAYSAVEVTSLEMKKTSSRRPKLDADTRAKGESSIRDQLYETDFERKQVSHRWCWRIKIYTGNYRLWRMSATCMNECIGVCSGISTMGRCLSAYHRGVARRNDRMTELRAKRVTHAQSPYITVGACKLFNSLAHPPYSHRGAFSLSPIFLSLALIVPRVSATGPQIIEAQLKREGRSLRPG